MTPEQGHELRRACALKQAADLTLEARLKDYDAALLIQDPAQIEAARTAVLIAMEAVLDHAAASSRLVQTIMGARS